MLLRIKAILASAVLALGFAAVPSVEAAKRLTVPDPDWTGGVVTCRTIQYVLENELGYKVKTVAIPGGPGVVRGDNTVLEPTFSSGQVGGVSPTVLEIDVTADVLAWASGQPNYGWGFVPTGHYEERWDNEQRVSSA